MQVLLVYFLSKFKLLLAFNSRVKSTEGMRFTRLLNDSVTSCNCDLAKLHDLCGVLSGEIHSKRWRPRVVLIAAGLTTEQQCIVVKLAESLGFVVDFLQAHFK